jgi:putative redox protein
MMNLFLSKTKGVFGLELENDRGETVEMNATPCIGGEETGFRPMELLAGSLAGCSSIDILHILQKQKLFPKAFEVKIKAKRRENEVPSTFASIHLVFQVSTEIPISKVEKAASLSIEKYCSVAKILEPTCKVTWEIQTIR